MFKKKSLLGKYRLKYTDRKAYTRYKWEVANNKKIRYADSVLASGRLTNIKDISKTAQLNGQLNFSHSGNAGDIIYALPTLKEIHEITGANINLYLTLGQPLHYTGDKAHSMGNVMLNEKMATMLLPLISTQPYINECRIYSDQEIHIDLDYFRDGLIPQDKGNIARWCGYITGTNAPLWKPWLNVIAEVTFSETIIVARSERYRGKAIDYSFLDKYDNIEFIGVESEFKDMKKFLPDLSWLKVENFLEMAAIIAGCKLFVGNQSFPYSIAEALKVTRLLEVSFDVINVVPEGENGFDFLFQDHFESLVERFIQ